MNAYFEKLREDEDDFVIQENNNTDFPLHYHSSIEVVIVKSGSFDVICNGVQYQLNKNSIAFFDSYDIHGYIREGKENREDYVLIIPTKYYLEYKKKYEKKHPSVPVIVDETLCEKLVSIIENIVLNNNEESVKRSAIDLILFLIGSRLNFSEYGGRAETDSVREVLKFINSNYREDINLTIISKNLGYSSECVSRLFNKYVKKSIPLYINKLRLDYVERHFGEEKITTLIFSAGFKSIQSYYRNKSRLKDK